MSQRSIPKCLYVMLSSFVLTGYAQAAGCQYSAHYEREGGLSGWPARVQNSSDAKLRTAYENDTCYYLKGEHGSGTVPPGAASDKHVTVSRSGVACHVFKKSSSLPPGSYNPTTCF
ncbi:hypothetical protein [Burkholderia ubonensis]|uniref:hypothetical protein n=1 Tax=Burkholderia ubonensis TaxID=101571 RepID=UPI00075E769E|nr:hypothetical protein [Burkholderia ubonensis]KVW31759.1 hypothetical protein WK95_02310 [Burkholderia ubonensis]